MSDDKQKEMYVTERGDVFYLRPPTSEEIQEARARCFATMRGGSLRDVNLRRHVCVKCKKPIGWALDYCIDCLNEAKAARQRFASWRGDG